VPPPERIGGELVERPGDGGDGAQRLGQALALGRRGGAGILLRQREHHDLEMIVDPVAEQGLDLRDEALADLGGAPAQDPEEGGLNHARRERGTG
jgi:hypothetical protein